MDVACGTGNHITYLKDSFDTLYAEGETAPKMMSIGLHCRIVGRPGRAAALKRALDYMAGHEGVWFASDPDTGLQAIIGVHSTVLGPALGGTRIRPYRSRVT